MNTPRHIIGDFCRLYRRPAHVMRLDLEKDDQFWAFIKATFEAGIVTAGLDPDTLPDALGAADGVFQPLVDRGLWKAKCPTCSGYTVVRRNVLTHICYPCWDQPDGPYWRTLEWPDDVADIESMLLCRPNVANRNWYPPETVADLSAENIANGVRLP